MLLVLAALYVMVSFFAIAYVLVNSRNSTLRDLTTREKCASRVAGRG